MFCNSGVVCPSQTHLIVEKVSRHCLRFGCLCSTLTRLRQTKDEPPRLVTPRGVAAVLRQVRRGGAGHGDGGRGCPGRRQAARATRPCFKMASLALRSFRSNCLGSCLQPGDFTPLRSYRNQNAGPWSREAAAQHISHHSR